MYIFCKTSEKNRDESKFCRKKIIENIFGDRAEEIFNQQLELSYLDRLYKLLHPLADAIQSKNISFLQRVRLHYHIKVTLDYEKVWCDHWFTPECASEKTQIDLIVHQEVFERCSPKKVLKRSSSKEGNDVDIISKGLIRDLKKTRKKVSKAKAKLKNFKGLGSWICASAAKFVLDNLNFNFIKGALEEISSLAQKSKHKIAQMFSRYCKSIWLVLAGSFWVLFREYRLTRKYNKSLKVLGMQKILRGVLSQIGCNESNVNYYLNSSHSRNTRIVIKISALTMSMLSDLLFASEKFEINSSLILYFVLHQIFSEVGAQLLYRCESHASSNPLEDDKFLFKKEGIKFIGKCFGQELFGKIIPHFTFFNFIPRKKNNTSEINDAKKALHFFCDSSERRPTDTQLKERRNYLVMNVVHPDSCKRMNKTDVGGCSTDKYVEMTEAYEFFQGFSKQHGEGQGVNLCWPSVITN